MNALKGIEINKKGSENLASSPAILHFSGGILLLFAGPKSILYKILPFLYKILGLLYKILGLLYKISSLLYKILDLLYKISGLLYKISGLLYKISGLLYKILGLLCKNEEILCKIHLFSGKNDIFFINKPQFCVISRNKAVIYQPLSIHSRLFIIKVL